MVSEVLEYSFIISLFDTVGALCMGAGKLRRGMKAASGLPLASCVTRSELFNLSTPTWSYLQNEDNYIYLAGLLSEVEVSSYY